MRYGRRTSGRKHSLFEPLERRQMLTTIVVAPQPIALQTPHLYSLVRPAGGGAPLADGNGTFYIDSLFDSASPGLVLNSNNADFIGVTREQAPGGGDALFAHNFSNGEIDLSVSDPLDLQLASNHVYTTTTDPTTDPSWYTTDAGTKSLEIGTIPASSNPFDNVSGIVGMGAIGGNVLVMDQRPANTFDTAFSDINTFIYPPGTAFNSATEDTDPGIPTVSNNVQLSYGDYTRFMTNLSGAPTAPDEHTLPFVGPNPINPTLPDNTPPVSFSLGAGNGTGSFLLDTASSSSMISLAKAASLGVTYAPGTFGTSNAALVGVPASQQFRLTLQSLAGPVTLAGFYASTLTLQSDAGPIIFNNAPLLVGDATLGNASGPQVTLDGVLGMNLFAASASVDSHGKLDNQTPGAFNWIKLNEPAGTLGLDIASVSTNPQVVSSSFNFTGTQQSITMNFANVTDPPDVNDLTFTKDGVDFTTNVAMNFVVGPNNASTATFTFPSLANGMLPDGNYIVTLGSYNYSIAFWSFQGDATHDRSINALDLNALASNFGGANQGFSNGDFNYDGIVNTSDFTLLAARFNQFFTGPDAPGRLLAPGAVVMLPSGAAAPVSALAASPLAGSLFGDRLLTDESWAKELVSA